MPRPEPHPEAALSFACAAARRRIDAVHAGDPEELDADGRRRLDEHLAGCPACAEEHRRAEELSAALRRGLPLLACPPEVTERVMAVARRESAAAGEPAATAKKAAPWTRRRWSLPPAAAAALLVLALLPLAVARHQRPAPAVVVAERAPAAAVDPVEVARAEREARLVLGYVARVGRRAGGAVRDDVLGAMPGGPTAAADSGGAR